MLAVDIVSRRACARAGIDGRRPWRQVKQSIASGIFDNRVEVNIASTRKATHKVKGTLFIGEYLILRTSERDFLMALL